MHIAIYQETFGQTIPIFSAEDEMIDEADSPTDPLAGTDNPSHSSENSSVTSVNDFLKDVLVERDKSPDSETPVLSKFLTAMVISSRETGLDLSKMITKIIVGIANSGVDSEAFFDFIK